MSPTSTKPVHSTWEPEPTWDIAHLFPLQGTWTVDEYLALNGNYLIEFSNGVLEVLPLPTTEHQLLSAYLYGLLLAFATHQDLGMVLYAPVRVRLWPGKYREPDLLFMLKEHADRIGSKFWKGADLVMEIVSEGDEDRRRDLVKKREDYERAAIPEYWIVDPQEECITVLRLARKRYVVHGEFGKGEVASSHLLPGFTVDVSEALAKQLPTARRKGRGAR